MKNFASIVLIALLLSTSASAGDPAAKPSVALTWMGFDAGMKEARKANKKVLIDVYTDWCGWCKKMDKEVFSNAKIAPLLAEQYVLIKLNAESAARVTFKDTKYSEMELARSFGVTGYPTCLFLEPDGGLITTLPGYVQADNFLPVLKYFAENHYKTVDWQVFYDKYRKESSGTPSQ